MTVKALLITSPTCAPCKSIKPVIAEVTEKAGIPLEVFEVGPQSSLVATFQIRAVPTLILLDPHDKEIKRLVGAQSRQTIEEFFHDTGAI